MNSQNRPPIVFVAQLGEPGSDWKPVLDQLTCASEVITYDRPGTGNRPPRPAPNPPLPYSVFADELVRELDERSVLEPVVIVGHSVGSLIARSLTSRHPNRVAGIVHVDGSIPRMRFGAGLEPAGSAAPVDGDGPGATAFDTVAGEIEIVEAVQPTIPAAVITKTPGMWPPGFSDLADRLWSAYQRQLARQCQGPLVVAENAGHQMQTDCPELVAYVIDRVVAAVRTAAAVRLDEVALAAVGGRAESL